MAAIAASGWPVATLSKGVPAPEPSPSRVDTAALPVASGSAAAESGPWGRSVMSRRRVAAFRSAACLVSRWLRSPHRLTSCQTNCGDHSHTATGSSGHGAKPRSGAEAFGSDATPAAGCHRAARHCRARRTGRRSVPDVILASGRWRWSLHCVRPPILAGTTAAGGRPGPDDRLHFQRSPPGPGRSGVRWLTSDCRTGHPHPSGPERDRRAWSRAR